MDTFIPPTFFLAQLNARHTGTRDPLRVATYLSTRMHTHTYIYDTHVRARTHARTFLRPHVDIHADKGVRGEEATKVAYERDPANPRGQSQAYQFASNVGYPLEYDQQLEVLF